MATDLKQTRNLLGLSQRLLAQALGVSARTVARWEAGGVMHWIYTQRLDQIVTAHHTQAQEEVADAQAEANRTT